MRPFCIVGTPRSRTAWFAQFLTYGHILCVHEPSARWSNDSDLAFFRSGIGAADSMLTLKWRELLDRGVRLVAVVRPKDEVIASAAAAGLAFPDTVLLDRAIACVAELPSSVPIYNYHDLDVAACARIFKHCIGQPCPPSWLAHWCPRKVTADVSAALRLATANISRLKHFYNF